jgi:signal transduction histidine kinase
MLRHIKKAKRHQDHPNYRDSFEYRLVRNDGRIFNIVSYLRFKDSKKGIIYGISQDITDRKKVVEKLKKQNSELKKVNSELDRFVYRVSHDLRSPLTSVLGLIQVIKQETELGKIMHLLDLQEKSINKLDNFIKDIIDLSKNSRIEVSREEVNFQEMIENIFEEQSFNKNADKIEKCIEVQQNIPFISDARRISVIFNNLISNAIRYANPQQEQPFVKVMVEIKPDCAKISVKDNGLGITEEHHCKIFEMFYRASDTISGSGLGLYIVKETLEKLNGTVRVKSVSRKGTEFCLTIPNLHL